MEKNKYRNGGSSALEGETIDTPGIIECVSIYLLEIAADRVPWEGVTGCC